MNELPVNKKRRGRPRKIDSPRSIANAERVFATNVDMEALKLFLEEQDIPKYQILFGMMGDPAYRRLSFPTLLRKARISLQEIQTIYADGMRHIGLLKMMNQLPQIMSDVAEDAANSLQLCHRCDGVGFVPFGEKDTRTCPVCNGTKSVKRMGDKHARDLVFETAKLKNNAGPLVAIQNNFSVDDMKMESMLKRTRQIVLEQPKKEDNN